jgi:hypothetical protein
MLTLLGMIVSDMAKNSVIGSSGGWLRRLTFWAVYALIVIALAVFGGYYFMKYRNLKNMSSDQFSQLQTNQIITNVGKLYSLPKDEQPDVATVKDKEALKKQYPFFDQAENNDVVLIYKKAQIAILYRPATKKIVKSGTVNIQNQLSIKVIGKEADRKVIEQALTNGKVAYTDGGDAKANYIGVSVIDLGGNNAAQAKTLAEQLKGQVVAALPAGEDKPANTDVLIIAGSQVSSGN